MRLEHIAGRFRDGARHTVLLIGAASSVDAWAQALDASTHRVRGAASARMARDMASAETFDLALIEAPLSDDDGVTLGQHLWLDYAIPFLQMVAPGEGETVRRALAHGALGCLLTPVAPEQVQIGVDGALLQAREIARLHGSLERLSSDSDQRHVVSLALGMVMERHGVAEADAYDMINLAARGRQLALHEFCRLLTERVAEPGLVRALGAYSRSQSA